jgi:hypothetical protein
MEELLNFLNTSFWNRLSATVYTRALKKGGYVQITLDMENLKAKREMFHPDGRLAMPSEFVEPYLILKYSREFFEAEVA